MSYFLKIFLIIPILIFGGFTTLQQEETGSIESIVDGDTFIFNTQSKSINARLFAVDAPESNQPNTKIAKDFLSAYIGKPCKIIIRGTDRAGKILVDLYNGDAWINFDMAKQGLVWTYSSADKKVKDACEQAKWEKKGLYLQTYAVPPWEWRKGTTAGQWEEKVKAKTANTDFDHFYAVAAKPAAKTAAKPTTTAKKTTAVSADNVYICDSQGSTQYHNTASCSALKKCKGKAIKISKSKAKGQGKKPCSVCF